MTAALACTDLTGAAAARAAAAPERLETLLRGEAAFTGALSVAAFGLFFSDDGGSYGDGGAVLRLAQALAVGAATGLALAAVADRLLRMLRLAGARAAPQMRLVVILSTTYLSFYLAQGLLGASGAAAVVALGLCVAVGGERDTPQRADALAQVVSGASFVLGGAVAANLVLRVADGDGGFSNAHDILRTALLAVPIVYIILATVRCVVVAAVNAVFWAADAMPLPPATLPFMAVGAPRGALALLMVSAAAGTLQDVDAAADPGAVMATTRAAVIALGVVALSLGLNSLVLMPLALRKSGLMDVSEPKAAALRRARRVLSSRTREALTDLKHDECELMRGVDWTVVKSLAGIDERAAGREQPAATPAVAAAARPRRGVLRRQITPQTLALNAAPINALELGIDLEEGLLAWTAEEESGAGGDNGGGGVDGSLLTSIGMDPAEQAELDAALEEALAAARRGATAEAAAEAPFSTGNLEARGAAQGRTLRSSAAGPALRTDHVPSRSRSAGPFSRAADEWSLAGTSDAGLGISSRHGSATLAERLFSDDPIGGNGGNDPASPGHQTDSPTDPMRPSTSEFASWWRQEPPLPEECSAEARAEELAQTRARLVCGIKRYVFAKQKDGLLSPSGARALGLACDTALDAADTELDIWALVAPSGFSRWGVYFAAWSYNAPRRLARRLPAGAAQTAVLRVVGTATAWARGYLGTAMLWSCEVAIAYFMALTYSSQAQWLRQTASAAAASGNSTAALRLLFEVERERDLASRFVMDREIEAPALFRAVQTHRAAAALLRRQAAVVRNMASAGVVTEPDARQLLKPIAQRAAALDAEGPGWKWPDAEAVLAALPFFAALHPEARRQLLSLGILRQFSAGEVVWSESDEAGAGPHGLAVVVRGLVRTSVALCDGTVEERYMGSGSVLGLLPCATGYRSSLPGSAPATVAGGQLQAGALVFLLPAAVTAAARAATAAPSAASPTAAAARRLIREMQKEAGVEVLEALKPSALRQMARDWEVAAIHRERELAAAQHRAATGGAAADDAAAAAAEDAAREAATNNILVNNQELWLRATRFAHRELAAARRRAPAATILTLEPYSTYVQQSHVVLLAGSVQVAGNEGRDGGWVPSAAGLVMNAKIAAPAVLTLCPPLGLITGSRVGARGGC